MKALDIDKHCCPEKLMRFSFAATSWSLPQVRDWNDGASMGFYWI